MGKEKFQIKINDIEVEGFIFNLHPRHFTVEITTPYQDIRLSSPIIPKYSEYSLPLYTDVTGNLTKRGKETAKETLKQIYEGYQFFKNNLLPLRQLYESIFFKKLNGTIESVPDKEIEKIGYEFFQEITKGYHLKSSLELVQTLVQQFIIGKKPEEGKKNNI